MRDNTYFVPAPEGSRLALWHVDNGAELLPLLGWEMPGYSSGRPIVRRGAQLEIAHLEFYAVMEVINPDDPDDWATFFDFKQWIAAREAEGWAC